jgi:SPP1 family predicted phage head-tail adaptor
MAGPGAGELDRRITIQALTQTKDSEGGMVDNWADVTTVWAKVRNLSGNERRLTSEGGRVAEARTEFTIRYRSGLNERMRIKYGDKVYNIRHLNNFNEAREYIVITCDTGLNDGR